VKKPRSRTKAKAEDKPVTEEPALAAEPVPAPQQAEQAVAEPVIEAAAEPVAPNPVPAEAIEEAPAPAVPARRGWWNKLVD